jgi:hypothetical protein
MAADFFDLDTVKIALYTYNPRFNGHPHANGYPFPDATQTPAVVCFIRMRHKQVIIAL